MNAQIQVARGIHTAAEAQFGVWANQSKLRNLNPVVAAFERSHGARKESRGRNPSFRAKRFDQVESLKRRILYVG
jgi:hypothetical protein